MLAVIAFKDSLSIFLTMIIEIDLSFIWISVTMDTVVIRIAQPYVALARMASIIVIRYGNKPIAVTFN